MSTKRSSFVRTRRDRIFLTWIPVNLFVSTFAAIALVGVVGR